MVTISGSDAALVAEARPQPPPEKKKVEPPPPPRQKAGATPPAATKTYGMSDWEDNSVWHEDNGAWTHKGAGLLFYKIPPKGVFNFTVELVKGGGIFRGGKIRWVLNYIDSKNYDLFELDNKNFTPKVIREGQNFRATQDSAQGFGEAEDLTVQIDVTPDHIVHKMLMGSDSVDLDTWAEPGLNFSGGKFGFMVQGDDEIGINSFKFQAK